MDYRSSRNYRKPHERSMRVPLIVSFAAACWFVTVGYAQQTISRMSITEFVKLANRVAALKLYGLGDSVVATERIFAEERVFGTIEIHSLPWFSYDSDGSVESLPQNVKLS